MLCPANILGYLSAIRFAPRGATPSFRAECPALLLLREAPGHAVEESLFDVTPPSLANRSGFDCAVPAKHAWFPLPFTARIPACRAHSNCFCIAANKFNASSGVSLFKSAPRKASSTD
jgi:hypothetical protein